MRLTLVVVVLTLVSRGHATPLLYKTVSGGLVLNIPPIPPPITFARQDPIPVMTFEASSGEGSAYSLESIEAPASVLTIIAVQPAAGYAQTASEFEEPTGEFVEPSADFINLPEAVVDPGYDIPATSSDIQAPVGSIVARTSDVINQDATLVSNDASSAPATSGPAAGDFKALPIETVTPTSDFDVPVTELGPAVFSSFNDEVAASSAADVPANDFDLTSDPVVQVEDSASPRTSDFAAPSNDLGFNTGLDGFVPAFSPSKGPGQEPPSLTPIPVRDESAFNVISEAPAPLEIIDTLTPSNDSPLDTSVVVDAGLPQVSEVQPSVDLVPHFIPETQYATASPVIRRDPPTAPAVPATPEVAPISVLAGAPLVAPVVESVVAVAPVVESVVAVAPVVEPTLAVDVPSVVVAAPDPLLAPEPPLPSVDIPFVGGQFRAQDEAGQYTFGHWGGPNTRVETKDSFGRVSGSFAYVDPAGDVQVRKYAAAPGSGFRVAASDVHDDAWVDTALGRT